VSPKNILVVEDDPQWQALFREFVADAGCTAVVTASAIEAINALDQQPFALLVADISLSLPDHADQGGMRVLRHNARSANPVPAIVVTGYATVDVAVESLADLNARYLFKKDAFDLQKFVGLMRDLTQPADLANRAAGLGLSDREFEVLLLVSQGLTNKQIADELVLSVNTIKKHTQNIFTKLNVDSRTAAVTRLLEQSE
jgi:DNA-binding NarL/FixJ family response regulator